uniref:Reverse transcriptase N-terminal domain-containing protein n=1 Tax=Tolypiocladia glomerulata TaxID=860646 RepID=A0A1Z1MV44_9FLOR|nr:hypothetical protein [Tolypiocladia glomerulata]ARW69722.1 hypothetical protein [Tolypiocladia glomerulata]
MKKYELKFHILIANLSHFRYSWRKIKLRVSMIMKQIFLETKKHNLIYVYKLQNYLINSTEFQIFVFNRLNTKFSSFYYVSRKKLLNKTKESFGDEKLLRRVYQVTKQDILFNCISPTYNARIIDYKIENLKLDFLNDKNKYFNCLSNKYLNKKLICSNYIKKNVIFFLDRTEYIDCYYYYNKKLNKNMSKYSYSKFSLYKNDLLKIIINSIVLTDFHWYDFCKSKKNIHQESKEEKIYLKQQLILLKYIYAPIKYYIRDILISKLFIKINSTTLSNQIVYWYIKFFSLTHQLINRKTTQLIGLIVNHKLYHLVKKNTHLLSRYLKYKANIILNKNIYLYNIEAFYLRSYYSV